MGCSPCAARRAARKAAQQPNHLCPLNVDGRCQVYDSRPFNCRVFHSFDVDACKKLFEDGEMGRGLPVDPIRRRYDKLIAASANVALTALDVVLAHDPDGPVAPEALQLRGKLHVQQRSWKNAEKEFPIVRVGTYIVASELQGFSSREVRNVTLEIGARLRIDIELSVGAVSESVSVTGAAPLLQPAPARGRQGTGVQCSGRPAASWPACARPGARIPAQSRRQKS